MRLFIAATLPLSGVFAAVTQDLQKNTTGVRSVPAGNWHVTLRFLGETDEAVAVAAAMQQALARLPAVPAIVRGVGAFPDPGAARVAWAAVDAPGLNDWVARVGDALEAIGFPLERQPFVPHVTLARLARPRDVSHWVQQHCHTLFFDGILDEVALFRSDTTQQGAVYTRLAVVTLPNTTT